MENNMELYNKFREVPENAKKPITGGRLKGMTDINPMWRIKTLTEAFGPAGLGWWSETLERWVDRNEQTGEAIANIRIFLHYVKDGNEYKIEGIGGSMLISNDKNGQYTDDEAWKKAYTDAISVACKALGMGASVYWDKDHTKYSERNGSQGAPQQTKASSVGKDTPKTENVQKTASTESNQVQTARVNEIKAIVAGFADPQAIIEWALKKYHKALYCLTDEEYAELTSTLMERVNSKKEGEANE